MNRVSQVSAWETFGCQTAGCQWGTDRLILGSEGSLILDILERQNLILYMVSLWSSALPYTRKGPHCSTRMIVLCPEWALLPSAPSLAFSLQCLYSPASYRSWGWLAAMGDLVYMMVFKTFLATGVGRNFLHRCLEIRWAVGLFAYPIPTSNPRSALRPLEEGLQWKLKSPFSARWGDKLPA